MGTPTTRISVLVAEDNRDLREAVCALLLAEHDIDVAGSVDHPAAIVEALQARATDVVLLDLNLRGESSVEAIVSARRRWPQLGIVVFTGYDAVDVAGGLRSLEPCEFVSKSAEASVLVGAIHRAAGRATGAGH
jgi:DNA-binding NarL/FixJ family response regulator